MRDDDDHIRHYMPALRRIIIVMAVLTAIPVVLWTITAFVRTYVGPPKLPTFRPMSAVTAQKDTSSADMPSSSLAVSQTDNSSASSSSQAAATTTQPVVEARATATDARGAVPDPGDTKTVGTMSAWSQPTGANAQPTATAALVAVAPAGGNTTTAVGAAPNSTANPWPSDAPNRATTAQPPAESWPAAPAVDSLPPADPITGPVPLPRQRPRLFSMAGVPLPKPRPEAAGPAADAPAAPPNWQDDRLKPN